MMAMCELSGEIGEDADERRVQEFLIRMSEMEECSFQGWLGSKMMVCTNLLIAGGQKLIKHMHTAGLKLKELLKLGIAKVLEYQERIKNRIASLKNWSLENEETACAHIVEMVKRDIIPQNKTKEVINTYFEPKRDWADCIPDTAYALYNAVTRAFRNPRSSMVQLDRTAALGAYWGF
jgi:hypothetical protein